MEALKKIGSVRTRVLRDGHISEVPADTLVPGDIVILEGGDVVTADLRILKASKLECDESLLTGESVPVSKNSDLVSEQVSTDKQRNMLFKGTSLTRGHGEAVVVATGMKTKLGDIAKLVEGAKKEITPLEKRLNRLAQSLVWAILIIVALVSLLGYLRGQDLFLVIEMAIALAVAAIPEGLPIVATIALSRGVMIMAKRNALVQKLSAVETLGGTSVIFSDKTGTLTQNKMTVTELDLLDSNPEARQKALMVASLCNNASIENNTDIGDPMEVALLRIAEQEGKPHSELITNYPQMKEVAFDSESRLMATYHKLNSNFIVTVKGAPEAVLKVSTKNLSAAEQQTWLDKSADWAEKGYRLLAAAYKEVSNIEEDSYSNLIFLGFFVLLDPPRKEVGQALLQCKKAGIKVIMVTGDHPATALTVAKQVNLVSENESKAVIGDDLNQETNLFDVNVFARVSPQQKLDLIELYQKQGNIVGMTGDGVNDAPALKKSDIGISMGKRGTQVAHEASDIVLKDDAFATIVQAIEQGRIIFSNIRKFVFYLLSCNLGEIAIIFFASLIGSDLPILPLQILFLNLVTDVFPALALGMGSGDSHVMLHKPRNPKEPFLTKSHWFRIIFYGIVIGLSVLTCTYIANTYFYLGAHQKVSVAFFTLALAQLWHVFNMKGVRASLWKNTITRNPYVWAALLICLLILLTASYIPVIARALHLTALPHPVWGVILVMSFCPLIIGTLIRYFQRMIKN